MREVNKNHCANRKKKKKRHQKKKKPNEILVGGEGEDKLVLYKRI